MKLHAHIPKNLFISIISTYIEIRAQDNKEIRDAIKTINDSGIQSFDVGFSDDGLDVTIDYTTLSLN